MPGNDRWRRDGWVMEINGPSRAEEFINAFLVPFSRGHRLSNKGDRALKLCTLLAFPPPPPGSVVWDVDLPPHLEAVGPEQLSRVVLDLAEGYAHLPSGLCPNRRVIVDELLPALEELTQIPKCTWCLYPSPACTCGGVQAQAQHRVRGPPEDPPPPYQLEAPTTIGSTHQPTAGTPSSRPSHAQTPGCAYFQRGITYPTPILGAPEEPPPMWTPAAVECGLRPTIEPLSQATMTTLPPPPETDTASACHPCPHVPDAYFGPNTLSDICQYHPYQGHHRLHRPLCQLFLPEGESGPWLGKDTGAHSSGLQPGGNPAILSGRETEACPVSRMLPIPGVLSISAPVPKVDSNHNTL